MGALSGAILALSNSVLFVALTPMFSAGTVGLVVGMSVGTISGVFLAVQAARGAPKLDEVEKKRADEVADFYKQLTKR